MMMIRKVEPGDQEAVLRLLRTDFYPYEPCAVGLDLCPLGYRIPALEAALVKIMEEGRSYVAVEEEAPEESTESIVGVVLCSLMKRDDSTNNPDEEEFDLPEKFRKLEKFFDDLKTDYGERCVFDDLATEAVLDVFILATRAARRRKGVGQNLVMRALEEARAEGVAAACTMGLSIFSQKIFHRLQFSPQVQWRLSSKITDRRTKSSSTLSRWEFTSGEFSSH